MEDCPNGWKQWWLTSKLPLMKRLIMTTFMQHEKLKRKRQWNHLIVTLWAVQPSLWQLASSHWGSWREISLLRPQWCDLHTWRKRPLMMRKALIVRTLMALTAWLRNSWCALPEPWKMHSKTGNAVIIAAAQIISSGIVHWWNWSGRNWI